ncbi:MAG: hypothetical protein RJS97_02880 [Parvibaculaceae bacterium]
MSEQARQEVLARIKDQTDLSEEDLRAAYAPGSFGCHEALHTSQELSDFIQRALVEHPAIAASPAWFGKALRASELLNELYQDIGAEHGQAGPGVRLGK